MSAKRELGQIVKEFRLAEKNAKLVHVTSFQALMKSITIDGLGKIALPLKESDILKLVELFPNKQLTSTKRGPKKKKLNKIIKIPPQAITLKATPELIAQALKTQFQGLGVKDGTLQWEVFLDGLWILTPGDEEMEYVPEQKHSDKFLAGVCMLELPTDIGHKNGHMTVVKNDRSGVIHSLSTTNAIGVITYLADSVLEVKKLVHGYRLFLVYEVYTPSIPLYQSTVIGESNILTTLQVYKKMKSLTDRWFENDIVNVAKDYPDWLVVPTMEEKVSVMTTSQPLPFVEPQLVSFFSLFPKKLRIYCHHIEKHLPKKDSARMGLSSHYAFQSFLDLVTGNNIPHGEDIYIDYDEDMIDGLENWEEDMFTYEMRTGDGDEDEEVDHRCRRFPAFSIVLVPANRNWHLIVRSGMEVQVMKTLSHRLELLEKSRMLNVTASNESTMNIVKALVAEDVRNQEFCDAPIYLRACVLLKKPALLMHLIRAYGWEALFSNINVLMKMMDTAKQLDEWLLIANEGAKDAVANLSAKQQLIASFVQEYRNVMLLYPMKASHIDDVHTKKKYRYIEQLLSLLRKGLMEMVDPAIDLVKSYLMRPPDYPLIFCKIIPATNFMILLLLRDKIDQFKLLEIFRNRRKILADNKINLMKDLLQALLEDRSLWDTVIQGSDVSVENKQFWLDLLVLRVKELDGTMDLMTPQDGGEEGKGGGEQQQQLNEQVLPSWVAGNDQTLAQLNHAYPKLAQFLQSEEVTCCLSTHKTKGKAEAFLTTMYNHHVVKSMELHQRVEVEIEKVKGKHFHVQLKKTPIQMQYNLKKKASAATNAGAGGAGGEKIGSGGGQRGSGNAASNSSRNNANNEKERELQLLVERGDILRVQIKAIRMKQEEYGEIASTALVKASVGGSSSSLSSIDVMMSGDNTHDRNNSSGSNLKSPGVVPTPPSPSSMKGTSGVTATSTPSTNTKANKAGMTAQKTSPASVAMGRSFSQDADDEAEREDEDMPSLIQPGEEPIEEIDSRSKLKSATASRSSQGGGGRGGTRGRGGGSTGSDTNDFMAAAFIFAMMDEVPSGAEGRGGGQRGPRRGRS